MTPEVSSALALTLKIAGLATVISVALAVPLARLLARRQGPGWHLLYVMLSLPMVMPPTAVGYLLLQLMAVESPQGLTVLGVPVQLLLTWQAAVVAATVMAFPLVLRTAKAAFDEVDPALEAMAQSLGHSPLQTFWVTTLPLARRGLMAAGILGFTRAASEFGATVTVAGNIPFKTQTLASAIYGAQQLGKDGDAVVLIVMALGIGFVAMMVAEWLVRRPRRGTFQG